MKVPLAFMATVIIWSTTPLAIKWSGENVGFLFGVSSRMLIGGLLAISAVAILKISYSRSKQAIQAYLASGIGIYIAMLFGYWGATYIPSGWLSVIWGTSPVLTGIMASFLLGEKLSFFRLLGVLSGLAGLAAIFIQSVELSFDQLFGVGLVVIAVIGQTSTAVLIKKVNCQQHGLVMTAAGLTISVPLFLLSWFLFDGELPQQIPAYTGLSIVYLAVFGSLIGFSLYYFLIHNLEASKVSLITLITPVTALLLGKFLNNETITSLVLLGTAFILLGLISFQWGDNWYRRYCSKSL